MNVFQANKIETIKTLASEFATLSGYDEVGVKLETKIVLANKDPSSQKLEPMHLLTITMGDELDVFFEITPSSFYSFINMLRITNTLLKKQYNISEGKGSEKPL